MHFHINHFCSIKSIYFLFCSQYDTKKGSKYQQNHQGYRQNKSDQIGSTFNDEGNHSNDHSRKSLEKMCRSNDTLTLEIELASTIRPQGKSSKLIFIC